MGEKRSVNKRQSQRQRHEIRFNMSCTPTPWRRYVAAGAALCCSIQALAQKSNLLNKGDADHEEPE
jgi:hypothetical protein